MFYGNTYEWIIFDEPADVSEWRVTWEKIDMRKSPWLKDTDFGIDKIFSDDVHHDRGTDRLASESALDENQQASEEIDLTEAADSYLEGYEEAQSEVMIYIDGYKAGLLEGLKENSDDAFEEGLGAAVRDIELTLDEAEKIVTRFWNEAWWLSEADQAANEDLADYLSPTQCARIDNRLAKLLVLVTGGNRRHDVAAGYDPKDIENAV